MLCEKHRCIFCKSLVFFDCRRHKNNSVLKHQKLALVILLWFFSGICQASSQIAIIIDDIGATSTDRRAFVLPKEITFSILPHTEFSTEFSYRAAAQNREVMLHMPMESLNGENLGPGALYSTMYPNEVKTTLLRALEKVPHAVGVNNHMGSKLTQMTLQMRTVMDILAESNLYFIDSRTTKFTKAQALASQAGVTSASRHIFLDHYQNEAFINRQFQALIKRARKRGKAIGIAHPYSVTIDYLPKLIAELPDDIELITVSQFLRETNKFRINPRLANTPSINDAFDTAPSAPNE